MGLKDTAAKNFFGIREVMADLMRVILLREEVEVNRERLTLVSGESYRITQKADGKLRSDNRYRDLLFEYDTGKEIISVGFELQSKRDRRMVPRIMGYDSLRYDKLMQENRMHRIINLVLHFDRDGLRPASELTQMMPNDGIGLGGCFYNYGFVSLNIYDLAEKWKSFHCAELRRVLYYFKLERDGGPLMEALAADMLSRDAAILCAVFLGLEFRIDDKSEEIDMCKAFRDFKRECINKGKKLGREKGFAEGHVEGFEKGEKTGMSNALKSFVERLFGMNYSVPDICLLTGASENTVREITLSLQPQA